MITREHLLDELRYEYGEGRLVPFLGSGMSRPVCRGWADMIAQLERSDGAHLEPQPAQVSGQDDFELTRRAARALEQLRLEGGEGRVANVVRQALLESGPAPPPLSTATLARLQWPLVLTTNYDDLYVAAAHAEFLRTRIGARRDTSEAERRTPAFEVVGRSPSDCHRVLSALRRPTRNLIWTLQGFLPGQARIVIPPDRQHSRERTESWFDYVSGGSGNPGFSSAELQGQLVVGHAEYRAVAMRSETFRRAFAEVCRSRSLLFLGSGLRDRYLLDLFSQIAELYGPSSHQHYAVVRAGESDAAFMRRYFGILTVEVAKYDEIPDLLDEIGSSAGSAAGTMHWSYAKPIPRGVPPVLSVAAGPLTLNSVSSGALVLSGGGSRDWLRLSAPSRAFLVQRGMLPARFRGRSVEDVGRLFRPLEGTEFIWVLKDEVARQARDDRVDVVVARVRLDPASAAGRRIRPLAQVARQPGTADSPGRLWRDLRLVKPAMQEALGLAAKSGHSRVVSTLLSAGSLRAFPPSFALQEMIRAWAFAADAAMSLEVRTTDAQILTDMRAGRLDLGYLLSRSGSAPDGSSAMRFWLEITEGSGRTQRLLELAESTYPVRAFLDEHWLGHRRWLVDVWPAPCLEWTPWTLGSIRAWENATGEVMSLERLGVVHGSTLRVSEV